MPFMLCKQGLFEEKGELLMQGERGKFPIQPVPIVNILTLFKTLESCIEKTLFNIGLSDRTTSQISKKILFLFFY
jgi:hypothetical protein